MPVGTQSITTRGGGEVRMRWPRATAETIDRAIADSRAGTPSVVLIEGEPGIGKTTLLRQTVDHLSGFQVLRGYGEEEAPRAPLALLREWGALASDAAVPPSALEGGRLLGTLIDARAAAGPVALAVDDLQWVDRESIDAMGSFARRAVGDRVLIVAATRPAGSAIPPWARMLDDSPAARRIRLEGMDAATAAEFARSIAPEIDDELSEQLRIHTGGNPLHIRAMLSEHDPHELARFARAGALPAPTEIAERLHARVAELAPDASRLLEALAVLGDSWSDLWVAASVGEVADADAAVSILRAEGLLRVDRATAHPRVRLSHSLIRAAVYDTVDAPARRRLHAAAAARVSGVGERLRHRVAATTPTDEGLAADLDRFVVDLHGRGLYREASRYLHLAAVVGRRGEPQRARELDADFEALLARDLDLVRLDPADARSSAQAHVVEAMRLCLLKQWPLAVRLLDGLGDEERDALSPLNAYRARVIAGWALLLSGGSPRRILDELDEAAVSSVADPALHSHFTFAYGQASATLTTASRLWGFASSRDEERTALAQSDEGLARLAWRGSVSALDGVTKEGIDDLLVVTSEVGQNMTSLSEGAYSATLGFAQWFAGDWRRGAISLDLAFAAPLGSPHPLARVIRPLAVLADAGDVHAALEDSYRARVASPYAGVLYAGETVEIAALAFAGTASQRAEWAARRPLDAPTVNPDGLVSPLWVLARGIGSAWAGDVPDLERWTQRLTRAPGPEWLPAGLAWLRALGRRARGESAASELAAAAGLRLVGLPSLDAVLLADAATAAQDEGSPGAAAVRARALAALEALGAQHWAAVMLPAGDVGDPSETGDDPLEALSDRERDVVALVLEGLSYAQIADELYVTRSTVSFHLSNAYAKTSTSSRHELVQLVRRH